MHRILLFTFLTVGLTGAESSGGLREFVSVQGGYVARFPNSWYLLKPDLPTLYISSFPPSRAVPAVIVPENGATISIVPAPKGVNDIRQWIVRDIGPRRVLSRKEIALRRADSKVPLQVIELDLGSVDGPNGFSWYFELSGHLLKANLNYWKDDRNAERYRQVLSEIIGTLAPEKR